MPYGKFLRAAEEHRYALDRLTAQFGANVEQVAHRLTTLSRSGSKGVPFFMLRVDPAGNISQALRGREFLILALWQHLPAVRTAFQTTGQTIRLMGSASSSTEFASAASSKNRGYCAGFRAQIGEPDDERSLLPQQFTSR